jgi:hypothetical protein
VTDSTATDLSARLLGAEHAERESLLGSANPAALGEAIQVLGHRRETAAAEVLAQIDASVDDRALRKAARRELHRLQSMGIEPPVVDAAPAAPVEERPRTLEVSEAWATDFDATGSRALWLLADRPLGGVWFGVLLLNDVAGLQELNMVDTTRKRFQRDFEASRTGAAVWVSLPGAYSLQLVREALDLSRARGGGPPARYQAFREVFGEAGGPPERGLVYETISPVEINFNPGWLEESPRLLGEPEVAGWYVPAPAELRARTLEVARSPSAGLVVPGHTPEQQVQQLIADVARQALTPSIRQGLQRRLAETAYIFLQTDRLPMARLAAAAALALQEGGVPPERHPLVRLFIAVGLGRLTGNETIGGRRVAEVLLDLVERAAQQQTQGGAVETRPSGLILPR